MEHTSISARLQKLGSAVRQPKCRASEIGGRIRARRYELGLSQRELAEPGISYAYISRIESGLRTPSMKALRKIAPKLQTTVAWLETGKADPGDELAELVLQHKGEFLPEAALALAQQILGAPDE
jgi:transcriptional regulator with XRE-family HTH domain